MRSWKGRSTNTILLVMLVGIAGSLPGTGSAQAPPKKMEKVRAEAHLSLEKLVPGQTCKILIRLHIQPEWHINANPADPMNYVATEVTFRGKLGTKLVGLKYPKGEQLKMKDSDETLSVYSGRVDLFGQLEVPASAAGQTEEMEITIRYQACNDEICQLPTNVKLSGKLAVARQGEAVRTINAKLFMPEKEENQ